MCLWCFSVFFFKQKTAYEMRISDWSSDVCSSDLKLTAADFASDQEVRWRPGCGDYAILKAVQRTMPEIGADPAKTVFVSGIGCSSRFPYYRSEERRVGKECVSTCSSRWSPVH